MAKPSSGRWRGLASEVKTYYDGHPFSVDIGGGRVNAPTFSIPHTSADPT